MEIFWKPFKFLILFLRLSVFNIFFRDDNFFCISLFQCFLDFAGIITVFFFILNLAQILLLERQNRNRTRCESSSVTTASQSYREFDYCLIRYGSHRSIYEGEGNFWRVGGLCKRTAAVPLDTYFPNLNSLTLKDRLRIPSGQQPSPTYSRKSVEYTGKKRQNLIESVFLL